MPALFDIPDDVFEVTMYDYVNLCHPSDKACERKAKRLGRYVVTHSPGAGKRLVELGRFKTKKSAFAFLRKEGFYRSRDRNWWTRSAFW